MVDVYLDEVAEDRVRRMSEAARVDRAMRRTRRLLQSPMAADATLRQRWENKLRNQERQLSSLCR